MSWSHQMVDVRIGDTVYGSDGEKLGTIAEVYAEYIVVAKELLFPTDYYIPRGAITSAAAGEVYLNLTREAALASGWDVQPIDLETAVLDTRIPATSVAIDNVLDSDHAASRVATDEEIRIPVVAEELTATVRSTESGAVRVQKDVITEERTLEVPVTEERIRIERRVVNRPATATDLASFEEIVIEVPLLTQTVDIQKESRVTEEVVLSKEAVQGTERVTDTVRKEQVFIDQEGAVDATLLERSEEGSRLP